MRGLLELVISAPLLLAALAGVGDDPRGDLARMQGTWAAEVEGGTLVLSIEGETATLLGSDGADRAAVKGTIRLDAAARPRAIDFQPTAGTGDPVNPVRPGIYRMEGDGLEICLGSGNRPRPKVFRDDPANRATWLKFRRQPGVGGR